MKKKGFTLVELLVVISIIALLMAILMPALAKVKQLAQRMLCGTNLSGIGKAMMIYANDYEEDFPCAGYRLGDQRPLWGPLRAWDNIAPPLLERAFGRPPQATITSSFFLLVKYCDVTPKQFICRGDVGAKEFKLSDYSTAAVDELIYAFDFGNSPGGHVSYSYHLPYDGASGAMGFPINSATSPESPLCADKNPYLDNNAVAGGVGTGVVWENNEYTDPQGTGNSVSHQQEGQNVLFADCHVTFERYPNVGINNDNIWMYWDRLPTGATKQQQIETGMVPPTKAGEGLPWSFEDAYLVNE